MLNCSVRKMGLEIKNSMDKMPSCLRAAFQSPKSKLSYLIPRHLAQLSLSLPAARRNTELFFGLLNLPHLRVQPQALQQPGPSQNPQTSQEKGSYPCNKPRVAVEARTALLQPGAEAVPLLRVHSGWTQRAGRGHEHRRAAPGPAGGSQRGHYAYFITLRQHVKSVGVKLLVGAGF